MDPVTLAIGAGVSAFNGLTGFFGQREQNHANMELAKYQNQFNLDMWNRQNEYNTPTATMQRLTDAGINPRAYQQIGQFANAGQPNPAASVDYKSPISNLKFSEDIINMALDAKIKASQADLLEAQTSYYNAQSHNNSVMSSLRELEFVRNLFGYGYVDGITGEPFQQAYGYKMPDSFRGAYQSKDESIKLEAYERALAQRLIRQQSEEDKTLGMTDGIDGLAKMLIRLPYRSIKWLYNESQKR